MRKRLPAIGNHVNTSMETRARLVPDFISGTRNTTNLLHVRNILYHIVLTFKDKEMNRTEQNFIAISNTILLANINEI